MVIQVVEWAAEQVVDRLLLLAHGARRGWTSTRPRPLLGSSLLGGSSLANVASHAETLTATTDIVGTDTSGWDG